MGGIVNHARNHGLEKESIWSVFILWSLSLTENSLYKPSFLSGKMWQWWLMASLPFTPLRTHTYLYQLEL